MTRKWKLRLRKILGIVATLILPMIVGNSKMFDAILDAVFPPSDYYGGVSMPLMNVTPTSGGASSESILLLLQHSKGNQETIGFLSPEKPGSIEAGSPVQPPLRTIGVAEASTGSARFLEVDLPPRTLFAVSASQARSTHADSRNFMYSRHEGVRKRFLDDLIIKTRNENLEHDIFLIGFAVCLGCVGHAIGARKTHSLPIDETQASDHNRRKSKR